MIDTSRRSNPAAPHRPGHGCQPLAASQGVNLGRAMRCIPRTSSSAAQLRWVGLPKTWTARDATFSHRRATLPVGVFSADEARHPPQSTRWVGD